LKLITQQIDSHKCGQCCVAMTAEVSLEEAIKAIGKEVERLARTCYRSQELGIKCSTIRDSKTGKFQINVFCT